VCAWDWDWVWDYVCVGACCITEVNGFAALVALPHSGFQTGRANTTISSGNGRVPVLLLLLLLIESCDVKT